MTQSSLLLFIPPSMLIEYYYLIKSNLRGAKQTKISQMPRRKLLFWLNNNNNVDEVKEGDRLNSVFFAEFYCTFFSFFFFFIFLFFFLAFTRFKKVRDKIYCSWYKCYCLLTVPVLFMYCSWDPQLLYTKKSIKNGSHGTIHIFKNYFTTVFLVFSFKFQQQ